eukprot:6196754-Pleurochrysis_carterae.AAC.2
MQAAGRTGMCVLFQRTPIRLLHLRAISHALAASFAYLLPLLPSFIFWLQRSYAPRLCVSISAMQRIDLQCFEASYGILAPAFASCVKLCPDFHARLHV